MPRSGDFKQPPSSLLPQDQTLSREGRTGFLGLVCSVYGVWKRRNCLATSLQKFRLLGRSIPSGHYSQLSTTYLARTQAKEKHVVLAICNSSTFEDKTRIRIDILRIYVCRGARDSLALSIDDPAMPCQWTWRIGKPISSIVARRFV